MAIKHISLIALFIAAVICCILVSIETVQAKEELFIWDGYWPKHGVKYVTKFCFDNRGKNDSGYLTWTATGATEGVNVIIYDDEPDSWGTYVKHSGSWTCDESIAKPPAKDVISLAAHPTFKISIAEVTRPRFWYIALASCNASKTSDPLELDIRFENPGGWLDRQFSKDEQGIVVVTLVFTIMFGILAIAYTMGMVALWRRKSLHLFVKLFAIVVYSQVLGCFLQFIHYFAYAFDGHGIYGLDGLGVVFTVISEILFMMMLLFVASGWTITYTTLHFRKFFVAVFAVLVVLYVTLFMWAQIGVDSYSTEYIYATIPGIILACLRLPLMAFFVVILLRTHRYEYEPSKRLFYKIFGGLYASWFLVLPFIVILSLAIDPWYRFKVIESLDLTIYFIVLTGMVVLMWPSRANKVFDFATPPSAQAATFSYDNL